MWRSLLISLTASLARPGSPRWNFGHRLGCYRASKRPSMSTGPSATKSILIVEDDILVATDMEKALKEAGFEVLPPVGTAEEAMRVARHHRPAIALLDIELLGGTNGIELGSPLREELNIPSIFVSGHSDPQTVAASAEAQPISWLKKPFGPGSIVASVHLALKR
jgi:two-component system, response regulator PdtaR